MTHCAMYQGYEAVGQLAWPPVRSAKSVGARCRDQYWIGAIDVWLGPLQVLDLRQIVDHDVWTRRIPRQVVLVIVLGRIEGLVQLDTGNDRRLEDGRLPELVDVGLRDPGLLGAGRKDRRAVLRAYVRALAIELGRIVGHGEVNLQELGVADHLRIEGDLH